MSKTVSGIHKKVIEHIIKDLESLSLLEEDESILEGFYTVKVNQDRRKLYDKQTLFIKKLFGLFTEQKLILVQIRSGNKPNKYELVEYDKIHNTFFTRFRMGSNLYVGAAALSVLIFTIVLGFRNMFIWFLSGGILLLTPILFYQFIKSNELIYFEIPGKQVVISYNYKYRVFYFKKDITLFKNYSGSLKIQTTQAKMEDLFDVLSKYIDKTVKDTSYHTIWGGTYIYKELERLASINFHFLKESNKDGKFF